MNICEYKVKKTFFVKVEKFRKERDMNIIEALAFLGMKKTAYYECRKTSMISRWVVKKILGSPYAKSVFNVSDFEKVC